MLSIIGNILTVIGALGLFLFGMKMMSEALQKVAGSKMRNILKKMTSNRLKGILTGFIVTTTIQSSSATTVMLVSFVNAGLLTLIGSIGVIMGANIGTTVTAWIISILGFKVSMSALSLPLIGLSLPLFFAKKHIHKSWGEFLIGFAILFLGLQFLKDSVPNINENPDFFNFLSNYTDLGYLSILLFVLLGTVLTIVIQSSSATMALTLVLCFNGLIPFEMAAAMVLGENIGTTVTANIAAIVANASAKRTARAHLVFNLFGVVWVLLIFNTFLSVIDSFVIRIEGSSPFTETAIMPIALSIFHTTFNIINTFVLVWFAKPIAKVAEWMVKSEEEDEETFKLQHINSGFVGTPELSIIQAQREIGLYSRKALKNFSYVPKLLIEKKDKEYNKILKKFRKYEDLIDLMEVEIGKYLGKIAESELSSSASKRIRAMLDMIDNIESIGDICYQIGITIDNKNQQKLWFPQSIRDNLQKMFIAIDNALRIMIENCETDYHKIDIQKALDAEHLINDLRDQLRDEHVESLEKNKYNYETGVYYIQLITLLERLGDYAFGISKAIQHVNK
jgi:phosphate:Na+ symporter